MEPNFTFRRVEVTKNTLSDNYETAHNSRKRGDGGKSDAGDFDSQSFAAKIADRLIRSDNVAVAHGQPDGW